MKPRGWHFLRPWERRLVSWIWLILVVVTFMMAEQTVAAEPSDQAAIAVEALSRLQDIDLEANPGVKGAVMRVLGQVRGTPQFLQIVRQFKIKGQGSALLDLAIINSRNSTGADAMRLVLAEGNDDLLKTALAGTNGPAVAQALGGSAAREASPFLLPLVSDNARSLSLRRESVRALAKSKEGAMQLLVLAREQKLPTDLKLLTASELNNASWPEVKTEAARALPLPKAAGAENLPPIADLIRRNGDPVRGAEVFKREVVGCNKCHLVKGEGTDFGPNLSEIGTKLGKEALYESILDPSAGIAFGFEGWQLELANGEEISGLIISETADEIAMKAVGGVIAHYKKSDIVRRFQQKLSAMPADLQQGLATQDLIDLVEYLASLKH